MKLLYLRLLFLLLVIPGFKACKKTAVDTTELVRMSVYGISTNPIVLDWTIHDEIGSARITLNNNNTPYIIQHRVAESDYGPVILHISDFGSTANNMVDSGINAVGGASSGTLLTVDLNVDIRLADGSFPTGKGDFLVDAAGHYYIIDTDPNAATPNILYISDPNSSYTDGAWQLYTSNRSNITVRVERDGTTIHVHSAAGTTVEPVDLVLSGAAW